MSHINYPEGTRWPTSSMVAVPEEVRVAVDETLFQGGRFILYSDDLWAIVSTYTGKVEAFEDDKGDPAKDVPVWFADAINAFLETPEGQQRVQYWINHEMEG